MFPDNQGSQFTSERFRKELDKLGIRQRFGAVGKVGSIALIERLWRTLKELLVSRVFPPLVQTALERRFEMALRYYAFHRPHQTLGGSTPAEIYFGLQQEPKEPASSQGTARRRTRRALPRRIPRR